MRQLAKIFLDTTEELIQTSLYCNIMGHTFPHDCHVCTRCGAQPYTRRNPLKILLYIAFIILCIVAFTFVYLAVLIAKLVDLLIFSWSYFKYFTKLIFFSRKSKLKQKYCKGCKGKWTFNDKYNWTEGRVDCPYSNAYVKTTEAPIPQCPYSLEHLMD